MCVCLSVCLCVRDIHNLPPLLDSSNIFLFIALMMELPSSPPKSSSFEELWSSHLNFETSGILVHLNTKEEMESWAIISNVKVHVERICNKINITEENI